MNLGIFELVWAKRGLRKVQGKLTVDKDRLASLPDTPENASSVRGAYGYVAQEAVRLNEIQMRSGYLDYLFAPELVKP